MSFLTGITNPTEYRNAVMEWAGSQGAPGGTTYEQMLGAYQASNPMPGETPDQFRMRMLGNFEAGGSVLPTKGAFGYYDTSGASGGAFGGGSNPYLQQYQQEQAQLSAQRQADEAKLEAERAKLFDALNRQENSYSTAIPVELQGRIMDGVRGVDQPFTPEVVSNMIGVEADASAAGLASEQELIRQAMANRGLGGSGMQASAMVDSQRRASRRTRGASRDIRTRAQLENYQARERAQQRAAAFLAQKEAAERAARLKEADMRSRFEVTGDNAEDKSFENMLKLATLQRMGMQNNGYSPGATVPTVRGNPAGQRGTQSSYGGVTNLGANVGTFRQTSGGSGYRQMGLGGEAGPWGAIEAAHNAAGDRAPQNQNSYAWNQARNVGKQMIGGGIDWANSITADQIRSPNQGGIWGIGGVANQAAQRNQHLSGARPDEQARWLHDASALWAKLPGQY